MDEFFGYAGLLLIITAWSFEVYRTIKSGKTAMRLEFAAVYFFASSSLAYYSLQLGSVPFMILNALAALVPMINVYYIIKNRKK